MENLSAPQAAKLLGITIDKLGILEKQGLIHATHTAAGVSYFAAEITRIKSRRGLTVAEEAAQVGITIQREMASSVSSTRKVLMFAAGAVSAYVLLVVVLTALFIVKPLQTAQWLGMVKTKANASLTQAQKNGQVLAAATSTVPARNSPIQAVLQPIGKVSLGLVKNISPTAYAQVAKVAIIDPTDVLGLDTTGAITPVRPIKLTDSSLLQVETNGLVANLNSQYVQGKKPGTSAGDIAVIGADGNIEGLSSPTVTPVPATTAVTNIVTTPTVPAPTPSAISGLTNTNLSGSAAISNGNLANSAVTIDTAGPLSGGGTVSLGGTLSLTCPTCTNPVIPWQSPGAIGATTPSTGVFTTLAGTTYNGLSLTGTSGTTFTFPTTNDTLVGRTSSDTLTNKIIAAGSNTISGLTASNLTAGNFSSKITSGTYAIDITGSAASATNFTGSLAGDVSGTQGVTTVGKINGAVLGTTTATSGNLLIASGTSWVTQALAGDATINSSGNLVLKNTGTAGTYGTALNIPVITTDAQGRVTGVTNTTIAGLTVSNFSSGNISQWTNNSGYITSSSTDTLTNKTISGATNTFSNIANSSLSSSGLTFAGNTGSGSISLGGTLTIVGGGINTSAYSGGTLTVTGTEADTLAAVTARGATTATALTLSNSANAITAGTLTATGGTINGTTIGAMSPSTGVFTTVNGLTLTNNGSNTLNIAAGKTLTVNNSITVGGTDGTSFTFPTTSDDIVGRTVAQTLTNKTIAAGSNTISGLTNTNLSGTAGITNANLANSSIATAGNSGSGSVSLGGGLTFTGAGITNIVASGTTLTVTSTEADTLATVTGRGSATSTSISTTGAGTITSAGLLTAANGLTLTTGALTLTATSGALSLSGLSTSSISSGVNDLIFTSGHFTTTATGINSTAIGQTTAAAGKFTTLTSTGATDLANAGASNVTVATTGTGNVTIGNATGTFALASNGGLNVTTGGALTGVVSIASTTSSAITLDSGTTGNVNLGTGANAKTVAIGNTTGATAVNISAGTNNVNFTVGPTSSSGKVQIGNSASSTPDLLVLDNGTADPTGVNGGMYYNTSTNKFRCYENSAWANCITPPGSDSQHAASYDTDEAFTNVPTGGGQTTLGTVSITPSSATGDIYVTGFAEVRSSNNTDQPFNLVIETTSNCTGTTVGNASVTYTISTNTSTTTHLGNIRISGLAVDAGASAHPYSLCAAISSGGGDTDVLNWGIEAIVIDTGADLAEIYTTSDASIGVGDVVSLDASLHTGMKKSQLAYDRNVLGIISTRPGLVIGGVEKEGVSALPVALSGRVPVKVSAQNGAITAGDYLTTSTLPGVAMKATRAGATIGIAMSSFDGEGVGQILAFVKNGSWMGSAPAQTESIAEASITSQIAKLVSDLFKNTVEFFGNAIFHSDVMFLGRPTFNKDTAGHTSITAGHNEVSVEFAKEYTHNPVVTASINLIDGAQLQEMPAYAIYDLSPKGFKIKLSKVAPADLSFSWIALFVPEDNPPDQSVLTIPTVSSTPVPSPTPVAAQIEIVVTPTPTQVIEPSPIATESATQSASPSANTL